MRAEQRPRGRWARAGVAAAILATALALGCARVAGPPSIRLGEDCEGCGMPIQSLRFACERRVGEDWRVYDSIECLVRDAGPAAGAAIGAWLPDYDTGRLHRADSTWVVHGSFPSPMGGGYAAFLSRAAAESLAAATQGAVVRLGELPGPGAAR